MTIVLMALAGGVGTGLRFLVDGWVNRRFRGSVPFGTVVVNVSASFLLGTLTAVTVARPGLTDLAMVIGTGFLGGYSTFSAAAVETVRLAGEGSRRELALAASYAAGLAAACLAASAIGFHLV